MGLVVGFDSERGVADLVDEEFRMYRYHQRLISGKPNFGWQRIMMYSLTTRLLLCLQPKDLTAPMNIPHGAEISPVAGGSRPSENKTNLYSSSESRIRPPTM